MPCGASWPHGCSVTRVGLPGATTAATWRHGSPSATLTGSIRWKLDGLTSMHGLGRCKQAAPLGAPSLDGWRLCRVGIATSSPRESGPTPLLSTCAVPKSPTEARHPGSLDELRRLLAAAGTYGSARTVALLTLLVHTGLRIGEALSRDVEHLAYDRGHRILRLERKGGRGDRTVLTAPVTRALDAYLDGRTTGPVSSQRPVSAWASPGHGRWCGASL